MELEELKAAWLTNNTILEKSLKMNQHNLELIQTQKVVSSLSPLYRHRILEIILHSIVIMLILIFLFQNITEYPYAASAVALLIMYGILTANAVLQIKLLTLIDFSQNLASLQETLVRLQTHIVNYSRLHVLFIPVYLAYPVVLTKIIKDFDLTLFNSFDIIKQSNGAWWTVQIIVALVFIPLGIWFYKQITFKNIHKTWVKNYITKMTGRRITKSLEFLKEIQDLKS